MGRVPVCALFVVALACTGLDDLEDRFLPYDRPPQWAHSYPQLHPVGCGSRVSLRLDRPGTVYLLYCDAAVTNLGAEAIRSNAAIAVAAGPTAVSVSLTNLAPLADHALWLIAASPASNLQTTPRRFAFTTAAALTLPLLALPQIEAFPAGAPGIAPAHTIPRIEAFQIAVHETGYDSWRMVRDWATNFGYHFANPGLRGDGDYGSGDHPVTTVNWYDALAWCNALSEYHGFTPVYMEGNTVYTDARTPPARLALVTDSAVPGFRLPDEYEWEYASRRKPDGSLTGGDRPAGYEGPHLDPDDAGATLTAWGPFAWYEGNASGTAARGTRSPTASGLYDLSGNVQEWCHGEAAPLLRGGAWSTAAAWLCTAARMTNAHPGLAHAGFGLRVLRRAM